MAKKYNFSDIYRQEPTYYIPILKLKIKGRRTLIMLYLSVLLGGGICFYVFFQFFNIQTAAIITSIVVAMIYFIVNYNITTTDQSTQLPPLVLWYKKRKYKTIIYTATGDVVPIVKKYKTKGVVLYGLHRKHHTNR